VSVRYTLDEQPQPPRTFELQHDAAGGLRPITLDLTDSVPLGSSKPFTVSVFADGLSSYVVEDIQVKRREQPLLITLAFPDSYPSAAATGRPPRRPGTTPQAAATTPSTPATRPHTAAKPPGTLGTKPNTAATAPHRTPATPNAPPQTVSTYHPHIPTTMPTVPPINIAQPPAVAPPIPTGLVARPVGPSRINVSWNPVQGVDKYILYRSGGAGAGQPDKPLPGDVTTFSDTELTPGTIYRYRIQAKRGTLYSDQSIPTAILATPHQVVPATVGLTVAAEGRDVHAVLTFANISSQPVYLDKVSACANSKIGDDVFQIRADGQLLPFTGQKSKRPAEPGPRQFITLAAGGTVREEVTLNRSYRFPAGPHDYSVTYSAQHVYRRVLQSLLLTSDERRVMTTR